MAMYSTGKTLSISEVQAAQIFRLAVGAGGTGGHIYPAMAVADELRHRGVPGEDILFFGTSARMESKIVPEAGWQYRGLPVTGWYGLTAARSWLLPFNLLRSFIIARSCMKDYGATAAMVTGAYISLPVGLAARTLGIPLVVMESNINPGKANRLLMSIATLLILAWEETLKYLPPSLTKRCQVLGNPLRSGITRYTPAHQARERLGLDPHCRVLLVMGGSLGARSINDVMQEHMGTITANNIQVIWITGHGYDGALADSAGVLQMSFAPNMGLLYAASDLVVCRSGATTVAELTAIGKPAILIPLPSAATGEQQLLADKVAAVGGAIVIEDSHAKSFPDQAISILNNADQRASMGRAMKLLGLPNAASDVADLLLGKDGIFSR